MHERRALRRPPGRLFPRPRRWLIVLREGNRRGGGYGWVGRLLGPAAAAHLTKPGVGQGGRSLRALTWLSGLANMTWSCRLGCE
jgi:hypothetical protein